MVAAGNSLPTRRRHALAAVAVMVLCLSAPTGCMTPSRAVRETDETGARLATAYWQRQTGSTNAFDVSRASDALTLRIALLAAARGEQGAVFPALPEVPPLSVSNGVLTLSLKQAMCVAARNDRAYQKHKETVFASALDLDYQQYQFETTFSGLLLATLSGDPSVEKAAGSAESGAARTLSNGSKIAAKLALDVASLLRDDWRSVGVSGDLTMTVPLLRGAGREIVREPLTQAERDLAAAIRTFARYRQTYAVAVATSYLGVLEATQRMKNALENERRLDKNNRWAEMMFEAGRMQRIQVDQARSDLLSAGESVIATRKSYEAKLDAFKLTAGLPPEAKIVLDAGELVTLEQQMTELATGAAGPGAHAPDEAEACRIALAERLDLANARSLFEDATRAVRIAEDALRADVSLTGKLSLDRTRETDGDGFAGSEAWSAGVQTDLPWNRRKERNTFKKKLLALEQAKRTLEAEEDAVKQAVRSGLRNVFAARASFINQGRAMRVSLLRVESNNLYLQSGRSSMRDVLEAESSLLTARNALCSAMILWRVSELELRRDMGVLRISEAGLWHRADGENHD
jgi:outer membrane protein TolC